MGESVFVEKENGVATICFNEPDSMNAFSPMIKVDFDKALNDIEDDPSIRVVVLFGKGRAYCAGGDLKSMKANIGASEAEIKEDMDRTVKMIQRVYEMKKIFISAVHGYAAGAGFSLALASDIVVAETGTKFVLAFKNVGLMPDLGCHYFLSRAIGPWKAKEWIWRGKTCTAEEGSQYGFINEVVLEGEAFSKAYDLAVELANGPIEAFIETKSILNNPSLSLDEVLQRENIHQSRLRVGEDHKEGVQAFFEKRKPKFMGR